MRLKQIYDKNEHADLFVAKGKIQIFYLCIVFVTSENVLSLVIARVMISVNINAIEFIVDFSLLDGIITNFSIE